MSLIKVKGKGAENLGRRNLIINGAMQVAQRGTSATGVTNNGSHFIIDRFKTVINNAYTNTVEQSTDVPSGYGFVYSLKQTFTTAVSSPSSGDYNVLDQNLEKQNIYSTENGTSSAKSITLSFWVKSSVTGTFAVTLQNYGSARRSNVLSYTISSANTWEKKIIVTTADTSANTSSANGAGLGIRFALGAGSGYEASNATTGWQTADYFGFTGATYPAATTNATWQVTGVQLEVGDTATDFEHRSEGEELALCQRYCYQHMEANGGTSGGNSTEDIVCTASCYNSTTAYGIIQMPVTMRVAPTLESHGGTNYWKFYNNGGVGLFNTFAMINATRTSVQIYNNQHIGITAGQSGNFQGGNTGNYIRLIAEL